MVDSLGMLLKVALFCIFAPFAFIEAFFYQRFGIVLLGGLYLLLAMQADFAASRFLRKTEKEKELKRQGRHWSEADNDLPIEEVEIPVEPLGRKNKDASSFYTPPPEGWEKPTASKEESKPRLKIVVPSPQAANASAQPKTSSSSKRNTRSRLSAQPNFKGRAHEILAVDENASTRTILSAFRHWIKRFHPDQNPFTASPDLNLKAQRITEAKNFLIEQRRAKKAA